MIKILAHVFILFKYKKHPNISGILFVCENFFTSVKYKIDHYAGSNAKIGS